VKIPAGLEDDPVFKKLGGGKADVIDKMSYLSKKELAKHKALVRKHNFAEYEAMALKTENEITLKDIGESEEERRPSSNQRMSDDEEGIEDLYEFWEQQEKQRDDLKRERNPNINQRLEDYLRSHSQ